MTRAPESVIQRGFSAGELAPVLHARADSAKYVDGLRTCRNFMVLRHGAVANRPGTRFVGAAKTNDANVRLQRFVKEDGTGVLVEVGINYMRFYINGAAVNVAGVVAWNAATNYVIGDLASSAGVNYWAKQAHINQAPPNATYWHPLVGTILEVPTTYGADGLIGGWEQSGNVVVITHRLHDPRELVYVSDTHWMFRLASTQPSITPPQNLVLTPIAGARTFQYVVTAVKEDTYEESEISNVETDAAIAAPTEAAPHVLNWDDHADAVEYNVYADPYGNGVFGFIGIAAASAFNNPGIDPDFGITPPIARTPFVSADTRPHVATHYKQRRFYGGSNAEPDAVHGSRTGLVNNFGISSPLQDDDAVSFRMIGYQQHAIRHMRGLKQLLVMTDGGIWTVGQPREALTPSNIPADQETYAGVDADAVPVVIGNAVIYVQARGSIVRDVQFDEAVDGLNGRDLTIFAAHLVDGHEIDRMDYSETPHSIVWCVRDDGVLLGLTYIREHDIWGWHRHDTDGDFEQVCSIPEAGEDALYLIVRRTIGGGNVRYIEKLESRSIREGFFNLDSFFVDSGLSYDGAPATVFSGLTHLNGKRVAVLADGDVVTNGQDDVVLTVAGGSVTIPTAASRVHVGLPIERAQIETLDLDAHGAMVRDKAKRTGSVTLLVDRSSRVFHAGPDEDHMTPYERGPMDAAGDEFTGQIELALEGDWSKPGRVLIWQKDPLPITILGIIPNQVIGG